MNALPIPKEVRERPRNELEDIVVEQRRFLEQQGRTITELNANLTATQKRCTELLEELRNLRELKPLADRLHHARTKHPEGVWKHSLWEEFGEVGRALNRENQERVADELLDLATVAMRMRKGEVAP